MTGALSKTVVAGGVVYPAGTAATPKLRELIRNPDHWTDGGDAPTEGEGYGSWKIEDLKSEIDKRNDSRDDDTKLPKSGNKADLVAVLESDDEA